MTALSISTVIPTYNRAALIPRAVESALGEARPGDEIIVVDDGSTDDTESAVAPYEGRIRYVKIPNGGAGGARNRGVREARGDLVAFLDSDDEWMPGKLELQRTLLEARPDILFCFSNFCVRDADGGVHPHYLENWHDQLGHAHELDHQEEGPLLRTLLHEKLAYSSIAAPPEGWSDFEIHVGDLSFGELISSCVLTSSMVTRREAAGPALRFAEDTGTWEDWECFGRLSLAGKAAFLDLDTTVQHGHDGPRLTGVDPLVFCDAHLKIVERVWGADEAFLARHGDVYRAVRELARVDDVRELIAAGRTRDARVALADLEAAPLRYRLLSRLPGGVMRALMGLRRGLGPSA